MKYLVSFSSILILCCSHYVQCADADDEHPFKNAKEGDWVKWKITTSLKGRVIGEEEITLTVSAKNGNELTLKMTSGSGEARTGKMDLTKPHNMFPIFDLPKDKAKAEKLGEGKEKIKIGTKEYECGWVKTKFTMIMEGKESASYELTLWRCKDVPLYGGLVKMEFQIETVSYRLELIETGSK